MPNLSSKSLIELSWFFFLSTAITVLWAAAAALTPAMQKGSETARNLHITLNVINVLLFMWQIPTGWEIVLKVFEFTKWPWITRIPMGEFISSATIYNFKLMFFSPFSPANFHSLVPETIFSRVLRVTFKHWMLLSIPVRMFCIKLRSISLYAVQCHNIHNKIYFLSLGSSNLCLTAESLSIIIMTFFFFSYYYPYVQPVC